MQREIKVRLLDKNKELDIVGYEKWSWSNGDLDADGYYIADPRWLYSVDGKHWTPGFIEHRYKNPYTGFKDKNGKEIYEGDIVRTKAVQEYNEEEEIFLIKWNKNNGFFCVSKKEHEVGISISWSGYAELEIIGNIYESPELLTENN